MNIQSVVLLLLVTPLVLCNNVSLSLWVSSRTINATANYTLTIDRSSDSSGNSITPSVMSASSVVTVYMAGFGLGQAACGSNCSVNSSASTVTFSGLFAANTSLTTLTLNITSIVNPIVSNTALSISASILTSNSPVDVCSTTITFSASSFLSLKTTFLPGNITYNSNLTLQLTPSIGIDSSGRISITLPKFWKNSKKNVSTNIPASITCSSTCTSSLVLNNYVVTVSGVAAAQGASLNMWINGVVSPPTLEPADTLSVASFDGSGNQLDQSSTPVQSTLANSFTLTNLTAGTVNKLFNLSFSFLTANIFASNDTITILLPSETTLTSTSVVSLSNTLVSSQTTQLIMPNTVQLTNTSINFANPVSITILLTNLAGIASTQPTGLMTVALYRNGYEYNYGASSIAATNDVLSLAIATNTTLAAANSTYTLTVTLTNSLPAKGSIVFTLPDAVVLKNCSASVAGFACYMNNGKINYTTSIAYSSSSPLVLTIGARNPVNSTGLSIPACSYDANGYSLDCGSTPMFEVQQASLPSSILTSSFTSTTVYALSNYTLTVNFSSYQLITGVATITFPPVVSFVNSSSIICTVDTSPYCTVVSKVSPIKISFNITENIQVYHISVAILRNPPSTEPFVFGLQVADQTGAVYYNIISGYMQMQDASVIGATQTNTNCTNSAVADYTVLFSVPANITISLTYTCYLLGKNISTGVFTNPLVLTIPNQPTLQPWSLSFSLTTADYLYKVFNSTITITNCLASYQPITASISGLGEDSSVISISLSVPNAITSLTVTLPSQYNTSSMVCLPVTPLSCSFPTLYTVSVTPTTQTISLQLTNIRNPYSSSFFVISTYLDDYLQSINNNTLQFQPVCGAGDCKSCLSGSNSTCTGCYSRSLTGNYIYNPSNNTCVSQCSPGWYLSSAQCEPCLVECATCANSTGCLTCAKGYFLNSTCYTTCPDKYYPDDASGSCKDCISPCLNCVSNSTCKNCITGYIMYNGVCSQTCPNTTISNGSICIPCSNCQTCANVISNCTSCTSATYLFNSTCLTFCPSGYVGMANLCLPCVSCLTCTTTQSTCTSCPAGLVLYNFSCVPVCPLGSYPSSSNCVPCSSACATCTSLSTCQSCNSPYSLSNSTCVSSCPVSYMPYQNQCVQCIPGCLVCTTLATCQNCSSSYFVDENKCVSACPSKTFADGANCTACVS